MGNPGFVRSVRKKQANADAAEADVGFRRLSGTGRSSTRFHDTSARSRWYSLACMASNGPLFRWISRRTSRRIPGVIATSLVAATVVGSSSGLVACTTANVVDVYTALDGQGDRKRNVFFTDSKEIHCVAEIGVGRPGVTIEAIIRQRATYDFVNRTYIQNLDRVVASAESSPSRDSGLQKFDISLEKVVPTATDGSLGASNPADIPYEAGGYVCEVYLDGNLEGSAEFIIAFPDCPTSRITPKTICIGFYEPSKTCPAYGVSSTEQATCTCEATGWRCP